MAQPLLCSKCERRFSDRGEAYVIPLLHQMEVNEAFEQTDLFLLLKGLRVSSPACGVILLEPHKCKWWVLF